MFSIIQSFFGHVTKFDDTPLQEIIIVPNNKPNYSSHTNYQFVFKIIKWPPHNNF